MSGAIGFSGVSINHSITTADKEKVNYAVGCTVTAKAEGKDELGIATYLKNEFDKKHGTCWHCIVGRGYSAYTECDSGCKIYFTLGDDTILLFRYETDSEPKPSPRFYPHISPSDRKMITKSKMDTEMEYHVFDCCRRACEWYNTNDDRAKYIKEEFDKEHNHGWNCIVGGNFAASTHFTHECYICINNYGNDNLEILLFRC